MTRHNRRLRTKSDASLPLAGRAQALCLSLFRIAFVAMMVVGTGLLVITGSNAFMGLKALRLTTVLVQGNQRVSKEDLMAQAQTAVGDPLMRIRLGPAAAAMQAHPWVQTATLRRQLPDRLHIEVVEHTPRALVMLDALWVANPAGEAFKRFDAQDQLALPLISGLSPWPKAQAEPAPFGPGSTRGAKLHRAQQERLAAAKQRTLLQAGIALLDALEGNYGERFTVQQLHRDDDLGWAAMVLWRKAPLQIHLGHTPLTRMQVVGATLDRLAQLPCLPTVIWANGERVPHRVQVQCQPQPESAKKAGAEKSQSVSNRRTMPLRTLPKR